MQAAANAEVKSYTLMVRTARRVESLQSSGRLPVWTLEARIRESSVYSKSASLCSVGSSTPSLARL